MAAIILTLVFTLPVSAQTDEFKMANQFYQEKDYDSAIRLYQSILNRGVESAPLYYNLGNAFFKRGELGYAVLNYIKARRLNPGDEDILHNLDFARQFSSVQMEGVTLNPINAFLVSIVDRYHLSRLAWIASLFFISVFVFLIVRFGLGIISPVVRAGLTVALTLLIISSGLATFKYRSDYLTRRAVIVAENSPVFTGPSEQSDIELEGAPGLIVEILAESNDYYNVLFENKRRGWIKKELLAEI